jgi:uncharacterized protein involved in oxidation of intracellular sulfur
MKILFIINDPPYGTERAYNAMRLALACLKKEALTEVVVFLFADAVIAARGSEDAGRLLQHRTDANAHP